MTERVHPFCARRYYHELYRINSARCCNTGRLTSSTAGLEVFLSAKADCGAAVDKIRKHPFNDKTRYCKMLLKMEKMILLLPMILWLGCKDEGIPPPGYQRTVELALVDHGTTDAWLRVRLTSAPPHAFRLVRDGHTLLTVASSPIDTLVADEPLLPNRSYTYKAYRLSGTNVVDSSEAVQVTTMDTTSSAWQWALDTLGVMNSYLADCAIIAPDNIWVVGQMYARDSLGNVETVPHNAAQWDGSRWNLKKIPYIHQGNPSYGPIRYLFALDVNDIWFGNSTHWNGQQFHNVSLGGSIFVGIGSNRMWGNAATSELYVVGNSGAIAYSPDHGTTWQRQESGTTLALADVLGTSANEVYAVGLNYGQLRGVALRGNGQTWQTMIEGFPTGQVDSSELFRTKIYGTTGGVWVDERRTLYTVGNLMYRFTHGRWDYVRSLPGNCPGCNPNFVHTGYLHAVRGNASNDLFVFGQINTLRHFNGVRWVEVGIPYYPLKTSILWYSGATKGNVAVAAGEASVSFGRGLVMRMWR